MAGLFRILTVVVFTAHIMLGCCLHHAHAGDCQGLPIFVSGNSDA